MKRYRYFSILNLQQDIIYDDIIKLSQKLFIDVNEDNLFDEIIAVNSVREKISQSDNPIDKKWSEIFQCTELSELYKIVSKFLSIPVSNAFVE